MRILIAGAGGTTRDLLRRLGEVWDVTVIDPDSEHLAHAEKVRHVETVQGDASSAVVLKRAGLAAVDVLIAATDDDAVNLEACRLALEHGVLRVLASAADPDRLPEYRELGVAAWSPDRLAARNFESELDPRRVTSAEFADGKAEAIEFHISVDSPMRGKRLADLPPSRWLVAAILRGDEFVVPHGDTVIMADDRVTVVGASADYPLIVRTFTTGEARFPLDFGKFVTVALDERRDLEGPVVEAVHLTRNSRAAGLVVVHRDVDLIRDDQHRESVTTMLAELETLAEGVDLRTRPVSGQPSRALLTIPDEESVGIIVVAAPTGGELFGRFRVTKAIRNMRHAGTPVLFSRSTYPYQQVVVPARNTGPGWAAARAAIDLAAESKSILLGVAVVPPVYLAGDRKDEAVRAAARLREEAAVQSVRVRRRIRQGNPVRVIEEIAQDANLTVLGMPTYDPTFLTPGVVGHLVRRLDTSVLMVPQSA